MSIYYALYISPTSYKAWKLSNPSYLCGKLVALFRHPLSYVTLDFSCHSGENFSQTEKRVQISVEQVADAMQIGKIIAMVTMKI